MQEKQLEFDLFADESALADAERGLADRDWIRGAVDAERRKYLPVAKA